MPGLAAEHGALDHQRVEALRGAVDGGAEAGRPAADDQQVDLLALGQLEPDPERPRELAVARPPQLGAAGEPHQRQLLGVELADQRRRLLARSGSIQVCGSRWRRAKSSRRRVSRESRGPMISIPIPSRCCSSLAALDEGGEQQVGERAVLEQQLPQLFAVDRDVAQRLGHDGGEEDRLPGEQVHLAEEAGGAVADDLVAGGVEYRDLALEDRDERVGRVADLEQLLADLGRVRSSPCRRSVPSCDSRGLDWEGSPLTGA